MADQSAEAAVTRTLDLLAASLVELRGFMDRRGIEGNDEWPAELAEAIERARDDIEPTDDNLATFHLLGQIAERLRAEPEHDDERSTT